MNAECREGERLKSAHRFGDYLIDHELLAKLAGEVKRWVKERERDVGEG